MASNLKEYLEGRKCQGFRPIPHYFADGDFITHYFRNDRCFEQRVDDRLSVYLTFQTRELVGYKIKGVRYILETVGDSDSDKRRKGELILLWLIILIV